MEHLDWPARQWGRLGSSWILNIIQYDLWCLAIRQAMVVFGRISRRAETVIAGLSAVGKLAANACLWALAEVIAHDVDESRATLVDIAKGPKY